MIEQAALVKDIENASSTQLKFAPRGDFFPSTSDRVLTIFAVEPEHIKGQRVLLKGRMDSRDVALVAVVPPALVIAEREEGW